MFWRCLTLLQIVVPYQYGQWVIEDLDNHDYLVISAVIPKHAQGYDTAHRTGIIGQVFRTGKSILASDVRNHSLYDAFDDAIDWELSFPVFLNGSLKAVVNLEGGGSLEVSDEAWKRVCQAVEETTQCQPPSSLPEANTSPFIKTRRIVIRASGDDDGQRNTIEMTRAIARGGASTLLVGHYPDLLRGRGPTITEASQQGLGLSYCFFGVAPGFDLLATGPKSGDALRAHPDWWKFCDGRYDFVLVESLL